MNIISALIRAFEAQTKKKARFVQKLEFAVNSTYIANNAVYKIETESKSYIFKVYSNAGWPENGKLLYVSQKLTEYHIPHAELLMRITSRQRKDKRHNIW